MPYYAVTSETGVQWFGYAVNAKEAVRLHMNDISVDSYVLPIVYEIPEPPEGWEDEVPEPGWLSIWIDEYGKRSKDVGSQVRIGRIFDADAVLNAMDRGIIKEMAAHGTLKPLTAGSLPLNEYVERYCEWHEAKFGETFRGKRRSSARRSAST